MELISHFNYFFCLSCLVFLNEASQLFKAHQFSTSHAHMTLLQHESGMSTLLMAYDNHLMTLSQTSAVEQVCVIEEGKSVVSSYYHLYRTPGTINIQFHVLTATKWRDVSGAAAFEWSKNSRTPDYTQPSELLQACRDNPVIRKVKHDRHRRNTFIMPDTKWCGRGNMATYFNDTGESLEADHCCREHDHCSLNIPSLATRNDYKNWRPYTISSCDCDDDFYLCLKNSNKRVANQVGYLYFNYLQIKCFKLEPRKTCVKWYFYRLVCKTYENVNVVQLYYPQVYA
jgi:secretory phospholipase A2